MAEFSKGFVPFNKYNVGNDYNPYGYGTAKVMTTASGTVTALSGVPSGTDHHDLNGNYEWREVTVLKNVVDTSFNKHEFINGIWHDIKDNESSSYQKPEIMSMSINIPDNITIEKQDPLRSIDINAKINKGTELNVTTSVKLKVGDKEIELYKTTDSTIDISITDPNVLEIVNALIKSGIEFNIVTEVDNGKDKVTETKDIKSLHLSYYGWLSYGEITPENISKVDVSKGKCSKTIDYTRRKAYFGEFYPEDVQMYMAIPVDAGLVESVCNGAAIYSVGSTNTDFIRTSIKINDVDYYLYVLQYTNHGVYNMLVKFDKGE